MLAAYGAGALKKEPWWSDTSRFVRMRDAASWANVRIDINGDQAKATGTPTSGPLGLVRVGGLWLIDPQTAFQVPPRDVDTATATFGHMTRALKAIMPLIGKPGYTPQKLYQQLRAY